MEQKKLMMLIPSDHFNQGNVSWQEHGTAVTLTVT